MNDPTPHVLVVDAFVACRGQPDSQNCQTNFGLDVDIDGMTDTLDVNGSDRVGFAQ